MNTKTLIRITRLACALILAGFSLQGFFISFAHAQGSKPAEPRAEVTLSSMPSAKTGSPLSAETNPFIVEESELGITLELVTADYRLENGRDDSGDCQWFQLDGYGDSSEPGWPRLPVKGVMLNVPDQVEPALSIVEVESEILAGAFNVCAAARPEFQISPDGEVVYQGEAVVQDPEVYSQEGFFPAAPAELSETAFVRDQRIAQIQFQPFQYNPQTDQVRFFSRIRVRLDYGAAYPEAARSLAVGQAGGLNRILRDTLENFETAPDASAPAPALAMAASAAASSGSPQVKLFVDHDGVFSISYEDLAATGADLSALTSASLQVFNQGSEIPLQVADGQDGSFGPGDRFYFYGQALNTRYTSNSVYWLSWGTSAGRRMSSVSVSGTGGTPSTGFLASLVMEENTTYLSSLNDNRGDHWFWELVSASSAPVSWSHVFNLSNVNPSATGQAVLRGSLTSFYATPRNHTRFYLNENFVGEKTYNPGTQMDFAFSFNMSFLQPGANTLRLEAPLDGGITMDMFYVNWFKLDYWSTYFADQDRLTFTGETSGTYTYFVDGFSSPQVNLYDVTDPAAPQQLVNYTVQPSANGYGLTFKLNTTGQRRFAAVASAAAPSPLQVVLDTPSSLKTTSNGADYLLISHADFLDEMQPLADWRQSQGMRVRLVDVQDIYDEFNAGIMDPVAIRDFIAYAYQNWQAPAPLYVLLVGDGNYDPRNYLGSNEQTYIPAYLLPVDNYIIETASDNRYVTVSGTDNFPDLMIGRLPVKTGAEAADFVTKLIAYEQIPFDVEWNGNVLFVADNADSGGNFPQYSDLVVNDYLAEGYTANKVYYGLTHTSASSAKTAIFDKINQGSLLVNYVGHGTQTAWASENLLTTATVNGMANTGKPAFFSILACLNGYFHKPSAAGQDNSSLAEVLVRAPQKGAIASWGSTGMGVAAGQDYLNRGLYQAIFYDGNTRLGAAALQAKLYLVSNTSSYRDLIDTFTFFGDPATKLNVRPSDLTVQLAVDPVGGVESGMPITYTLTYRNIGLAQATHVRIDHPLPEPLIDPQVESSDASAIQLEGSRISWEVPSLAPNGVGTIKISGTVNAYGSATLISQASIVSPIPDANENNNTSNPVTVPVNRPTAIDLYLAEVESLNGIVTVSWQPVNEIGLLGFNLYRSTLSDEPGTQLNPSLIPSQQFGALNGSLYTFQDLTTDPGQTYTYHLEIVEQNLIRIEHLNSVVTEFRFFFPITLH